MVRHDRRRCRPFPESMGLAAFWRHFFQHHRSSSPARYFWRHRHCRNFPRLCARQPHRRPRGNYRLVLAFRRSRLDVCRALDLSIEYRPFLNRRSEIGGTMAASTKSPNVIARYLPVYFTLLAIAALEFFLAYRHFSPVVLLAMLLALAVCSGTLAVMFFMHLAEERRSLILTLIPAAIFVLVMMNVIWTDSYRLLHLRPFAH